MRQATGRSRTGRVSDRDDVSRQEGVDDLHQLLGGPGARIVPRRFRVDDMLADMAFDHLGDEPVEGAAAGGRLLQYGRTTGFLLQRAFDGIELAADAANPIEQLLLVFQSVRHFPLILSSRRVYRRTRRVSNPFVPASLVQPVQGIQ
jgi:hypothetical protein